MTDGFCLRLEHGAGLRVAVKDLIAMEGLPNVAGSAAVDPVPETRDAACLAPVRRAGAAVVGRTAMHELAYGITGVNPWQGTPTNPLGPYVPGGSSSGAAVVVANGEADVALGTDTGGSVRIPAACCGVAGLKTTHGRISLEGVRPLATSFDTVGPLAADVHGLVTGMQLLEPGFTVGEPGRTARYRPDAAAGVDDALDRVLGPVPEVELPGWDEADRACLVLLDVEAYAAHGHLLQTGRLGDVVAQRLEAAGRHSAADVAWAHAVKRRWIEEVDEVLDRYDVIALPVLRDAPAPLLDPGQMAGLRLTVPVNLAGLPAVAVPVPRRDGPPASLQLVARSEEVLLGTALALEVTP